MTTPLDYSAIAADVQQEPSTDFPVPNVAATPDTNPNEVTQPKRKRTKITDKLGNNKAARGGPRRLTDADKDALLAMYAGVGLMVMPFKPDAAETVVNEAGNCVDAWFKLAEKNDSVRRALLAMMEGSAWTGVIVAHAPIIMSLIPQDFFSRSPLANLLGSVETADAN